MANTYTQIHLQIVFSVKYRQAFTSYQLSVTATVG